MGSLHTKDPSEIGDLFLISDETNKRFIENHNIVWLQNVVAHAMDLEEINM
ncbi:hypothetical protein [Chryseobacterium indoltheticum]|uniref:Uncharacterized protein n=1 Tax=Chryseobacterium indoltheticum TaxID=254 RepID=A0A381FIG8_9FLAO|nr:hypothetical protein [Chryseobacterium indoltheticum]SUX46336.1 Uncharacterised protein [Chryseobacterium indoltheticum]